MLFSLDTQLYSYGISFQSDTSSGVRFGCELCAEGYLSEVYLSLMELCCVLVLYALLFSRMQTCELRFRLWKWRVANGEVDSFHIRQQSNMLIIFPNRCIRRHFLHRHSLMGRI